MCYFFKKKRCYCTSGFSQIQELIPTCSPLLTSFRTSTQHSDLQAGAEAGEREILGGVIAYKTVSGVTNVECVSVLVVVARCGDALRSSVRPSGVGKGRKDDGVGRASFISHTVQLIINAPPSPAPTRAGLQEQDQGRCGVFDSNACMILPCHESTPRRPQVE